MELKEALQKSLKADKHTHSDPFLLHSRVCDLVGSDYEAKRQQKNSTALMRNMKFQKRLSDQLPCVIKNEKSIITRSNRCRYHRITHTFTLTRTPNSCICQANAPASRMHPKFIEPLTITPKCSISKGNTFLSARGFIRYDIARAFQGYQKAIKCISAVVAGILLPGRQRGAFTNSQDGYLNDFT